MTELLSYLPSIVTLISAIIGGGGTVVFVEAYRTYHDQTRKDDALDHEQNMELSDKLSNRLTKLEGRLDSTEKHLRETRKELTQSRIRRDELQAAIDALVKRIDRLISRLQQHEQITEDEKNRLTSIPYQDDDRPTSNTHSESNATSE